MDRTQIYLPEDVKDEAMALAERQGRSFAAVVRDALTEYVIKHAPESKEKDPVLEAVARLKPSKDGPADSAKQHNHYLYGAPKRS